MTGTFSRNGPPPKDRKDGQPENEVLMEGGVANRGKVVRVGNAVHRPQRPTSPATHALLRHLEDVGFHGAPRFLGIDSRGREVLSYIEGVVASGPIAKAELTDVALVSVARLLRDYHAAVSNFDFRSHIWPQSPPPPFGDELISHNDPNVDNIVFRDGAAIALIDFDLASPGSRIWDVAAAARHWAFLRMDADIPDSRRGRVLDRLRMFVDAYDLSETDRRRIVEAILQNHLWCYRIIQAGAEAGGSGYREYWAAAQSRADRTYDWYIKNTDAFQAVILEQYS